MNRSLILAGSLIALVISPALVAGSAGDVRPIGVITGSGNFVLDNASVNGNASLLEGSVVETMQSASEITLNGGGRIELAPQSAARVYADRLQMQKGIGETRGAVVQFRDMWVQPDNRALVQIVVEGSRKFQVAALSGPASVRNSKGILIARVMSGNSLELTDQETGATGPSQFAGCIQRVKVGGVDHYVLRDEATNVVIELSGPDVAANVGKSVQVTGAIDTATTPITGAAQFVTVTVVTPQNRKGCKTEIAAAALASGAAAGAVAGLSTGATVAIIGGVAAAATIGGLAAAGTFSGGSSTPPPVSVP